MNIKDILNIIISKLDEDIKNDFNLLKITEVVIKLITEWEQGFFITINASYHEYIKDIENLSIIEIPQNSDLIFAVDSHSTNNLHFSVKKTDTYHITLNTTLNFKDEVYEVTEINIDINPQESTWKITNLVALDENNFLEYNHEIHQFNKLGTEIKVKNIEDLKDKNFSEFFGIPLEFARTYRLNFKKYREKLCNAKVIKDMENIDNLYLKDKVLFANPFEIINFTSFIIDDDTDEYEEESKDYDEDCEEYYDDDYNEEYEENEELIENIKSSLENIKEQIISFTGTEGEFIMSYNLYLNLASNFTSTTHIKTKGILLRKLDGEYTEFLIYLYYGNITIITKPLTKEEARELYESDPNNKTIIGLKEYFEASPTKKLTE